MAIPKIFNDPIHKHIEVSPLCIAIIDTPQFQRLRDISHLGGVYYVFTGACSRRFEHCIGVSHLAKKFATTLQQRQPELNITNEDILCVEIAGLIHDLGHGPFSHLYDGLFLRMIPDSDPHFVHEHASLGLFDLLIESNNLMPEFAKYNLTMDDIHFIKELVLGDLSEAPPGFMWKGRGTKTFLYDIVANKRNGIDVDKFDYFARDCHVLGLTKSFDSDRLLHYASCSEGGPSVLEIGYHIKEAWNIFELFHTRYALHKRAYQHRVARAVELMTAEALVLADPYILISGEKGNFRMSQCTSNMVAYSHLTDSVIKQIEYSTDEKLQPARDMLLRLRRRELFPFIGEVLLPPSQTHIHHSARDQLISILNDQGHTMKSNDVICNVVKMGYGKGGLNPVTDLTAFYKPNKLNNHEGYTVVSLPPESVSRLLPQEYEETYLRVYARYRCQAEMLEPAFQEWVARYVTVKVEEELTPLKRRKNNTL